MPLYSSIFYMSRSWAKSYSWAGGELKSVSWIGTNEEGLIVIGYDNGFIINLEPGTNWTCDFDTWKGY